MKFKAIKNNEEYNAFQDRLTSLYMANTRTKAVLKEIDAIVELMEKYEEKKIKKGEVVE